MKEVALLIGGTGFVGMHMQNLLRQHYEVIATGHEADIRYESQMQTLISTVCPQVVINFASLTTVKETFENPRDTYAIGFLGTLNLLNALKKNHFDGVYLNISSSEVYGHPEVNQLPITEHTKFRPMSPYSVNKIAVEALCYQWSQTENFRIVTARPFTHIGPGQSDRFAISSFAKQCAEIQLGKKEPIMRVGNLSATRDITDVRDIVKAYLQLITHGENGEVYNVCSETEVSIQFLLSSLVDLTGADIAVVQDDELKRTTEQMRILGNSDKLFQLTGWKPEITYKQTLIDMLEYWRSILS